MEEIAVLQTTSYKSCTCDFNIGGCGGRRLACRGNPHAYPQRPQAVAHRVHRLAHFFRTDGADTSHAEGLELRELARIENETAASDFVVERLECVLRIRWRVEGNDDRCLNAR